MSDRVSILVADDDPSNLLALEAILEPLGHHLVRAASGEEVLKKALQEDFAVILLDVQMPGMDGFECAELLRRRPRTRAVPIIFLTAISKDRRYVERGYGVGAVDYLFKPYDPDVLRSKVSVFVELERKNANLRAQEHERYVHLADSVPLVVWTADAEGRVRYANARFRALAGNRPIEIASVVHPGDRTRFEEGWASAVASGREWEAELRFGDRVHLVRAVPARGKDGRIAYWIGTSTDIHDRVRAERAVEMLSEASRRLAASFEDAEQIGAVLASALPILGDAALLELDDGASLRAVVPGVEAGFLDDPRFGLGPSTVRYSERSLVHLDVAGERETTSGRALDSLRFLGSLGVSGYLCVPLASRRRTVGCLTLLRLHGTYAEEDVAVAEDLASRIAAAVDNARLHETTERRRVELEEANRSKDVFLATLSHELRTPLNAIVGWTDMMRSGSLRDDELSRAVDTIDRNAHALSSLVADLLDVSRIVTGSLKLDSRLVRVASIVEAAVEAARPQCAAKQVELDVSLAPIGCVRGDAGRLRQVFGNLLSNAVKFTPRGGRVAVSVARDASPPRARIVVRDTGEGIAPDLLPFVFDRFRQAENAKARGLGLGLAIVKHLVDEHGGKVEAASEGPGRGATFTIDLPIAAEESASEEETHSKPPHPASGPPALAGVNALVVEDDPDGNELITTILERFGAKVRAVGNAMAALDAMNDALPDVLVSDIGLPDLDGIELVREVRARFGAELPAIALTAYASRQDATKAISAGFDAHVAKPVQPAALGSAITRLLARRAAAAQEREVG